MANSIYEYVKTDFEEQEEIMFPNLIVVQINGRDFSRFSQVHEFEKPNDEAALNLMNSCTNAVMEKYPDIVFAYGYSDKYSFVFKKTSRFYNRRVDKILSLVASLFTALYVTKWKEFFPQRRLEYAPCFTSKIVTCATLDVLQDYLAWRQRDCQLRNLHETCFWALVKKGMAISDIQNLLKNTQKRQKTQLLCQICGINYKKLSVMFCQGTCLFSSKVVETVKHDEYGNPVKRFRRKSVLVHSKHIAQRSFWNEHWSLDDDDDDIGHFTKDIRKSDPDFVRSFEQLEKKLLPLTWIVVRIDGCHFHKFSEEHEFEKPNDEKALQLMNSCAVAVLKEFEDITFAYGVSDEYSFVLKKESQLYKRQPSEIISAIVSLFTSSYVMKWGDFFPKKELKYPPCFDGRTVCYPNDKTLLDYLAWRQVDCHINNQYNTCFWMLVKSGKSKTQSQDYLKGTQSAEKYKLLSSQFRIEYKSLPCIFRLGSSIFRLKEGEVVVKHCNIIDQCCFWGQQPQIINYGQLRLNSLLCCAVFISFVILNLQNFLSFVSS